MHVSEQNGAQGKDSVNIAYSYRTLPPARCSARASTKSIYWPKGMNGTVLMYTVLVFTWTTAVASYLGSLSKDQPFLSLPSIHCSRVIRLIYKNTRTMSLHCLTPCTGPPVPTGSRSRAFVDGPCGLAPAPHSLHSIYSKPVAAPHLSPLSAALSSSAHNVLPLSCPADQRIIVFLPDAKASSGPGCRGLGADLGTCVIVALVEL